MQTKHFINACIYSEAYAISLELKRLFLYFPSREPINQPNGRDIEPLFFVGSTAYFQLRSINWAARLSKHLDMAVFNISAAKCAQHLQHHTYELIELWWSNGNGGGAAQK